MKIISSNLFIKTGTLFYKLILPSISIGLFFGASLIIPRQYFLGSKVIDLIIRILLCLWFCYGYLQLPILAKKRFLPIIEWKKYELFVDEKIFIFFQVILFSFIMSVITWWTIDIFVPILRPYSVIMSILNGFLYLIPLIAQYEKLKF